MINNIINYIVAKQIKNLKSKFFEERTIVCYKKCLNNFNERDVGDFLFYISCTYKFF